MSFEYRIGVALTADQVRAIEGELGGAKGMQLQPGRDETLVVLDGHRRIRDALLAQLAATLIGLGLDVPIEEL
jgi:hypothetical protein